jgi:dolichyl-diphosphooligosaccharide--protein glycosyltransferase
MIVKHLSNLNDIKRKHLYILLATIVALGFLMRYSPFLHRLALGDTYYQFSIIKSILMDSTAPEKLALASYPEGKSMLTAPLLLPYFIAYTYKILQPLGISLTSYMIIFPAVFGSLAAIPLYLLTNELFDRRIAIVTALVYVVLPASIDRTFAGFVEKESLAAITVFLWLYLFIRSAKDLDLARKKTLILPILSGFFMAISLYTWRGVSYFIMLIALGVLIQTLLKPDEKLSQTTVLMSITGFTLIHFLQPKAFSIEDIFFSYRYAPLMYVSIIAVAATLPEHLNNVINKKIQPIHMVGFFLGIFVFLIFVLNLQNEIINMLKSLFNQLSTGGSATAVEAQRATEQGYTIYRNPFSLMISFLLVGVYYFFKQIPKNLGFNRLFVAVWFLSSAFASYLQVRLFFILAPAASMIIAYGFFRLLDSLMEQSSSDEREKSNNMTLWLVVILILSIYGTDHWENAMSAVRTNTPEDSLIVAFWDYGYVVQGLGERATIADPGGGFERRTDIARIYTSSEDEALQIIKKYNPNDKPVYVIVSFEEFVLANTINFRADDGMFFFEHSIEKSGDPVVDERTLDNFLDSNGIETYAIESIGGVWRIWFTGFIPLGNEQYEPDPEMKNKLLPKLLPFNTGVGEGLKHFRLVYNDDSNFIFIYQKV